VDPIGFASGDSDESTTYHLIAQGAGGTQDATRESPSTPRLRPRPRPASNATEEELFSQSVKE